MQNKFLDFYEKISSFSVYSPDYGGTGYNDIESIAFTWDDIKHYDADQLWFAKDNDLTDHREWAWNIYKLKDGLQSIKVKYTDPNTGIESVISVLGYQDSFNTYNCIVTKTKFIFTVKTSDIVRN